MSAPGAEKVRTTCFSAEEVRTSCFSAEKVMPEGSHSADAGCATLSVNQNMGVTRLTPCTPRAKLKTRREWLIFEKGDQQDKNDFILLITS